MALAPRLAAAVLATATAVTLAACSAPADEADGAPDTAATRSADDVEGTEGAEGAEGAEATGADGTDGDGTDGDGAADPAADAAGDAGAAARKPADALPEVTAAQGTEATNGVITVVIPESFSTGDTYDGVQVFDGAGIASGGDATYRSVQLYPAGEWDWDGTFHEPYRADATATEFTLDVPGADQAAMQFTSATDTYVYEFDDGETMEEGPLGRAQVYVSAGGQITSMTIITEPGDEGLALATSIASTITLN